MKGGRKAASGGVERARAAATGRGLDKSYLKSADRRKLERARERNAWKAKQAGEWHRRRQVASR